VENHYWDNDNKEDENMKSNRLWVVVLICTLVAILLGASGVFAEKAYTPSTNDQFDLGTDKLQYKDERLAGDIYFEGATHNAYETKLTVTDPTADRTVTLPNNDLNFETGLTGDNLANDSVTSAKIAIANVATSDIADSAVTSAKIAIANVATSDLADSAVTSAKIAIANVQASDMFINTVTATIAAGQTGAEISVEASSILIDTQPISGFSNTYTLDRSTYAGGTWSINTSAHLGSMIMNGIFIRP
jgi:hypothetical protein